LIRSGATAFPTKTSSPKFSAVLPRMVIPSSPSSDSHVRSRRQPIMEIYNPLVNIWRSDVPSPFGLDYSQEKNTSKLLLEAETLRAQAKAVMDQALAMEKELKERRWKERTSEIDELDKRIEEWFWSGNNHNSSLDDPAVVANRLFDEPKATATQVLRVADRIFDIQMEVSGQTDFLQQGAGPPDEDLDADSINKTIQKEKMYRHMQDLMEILSRAVALVDERVNNRTDSAVTTRWNGRVYPALQKQLDERRRRLNINLDRKFGVEMIKLAQREAFLARNRSTHGLEEFGANGTTSVVVEKKLELVPLWVPAAFLPFIIGSTSSSLGQDEVKLLLDDVLMGSRFYVTSHHSVPGAAIFRGNIRGYGVKDGNTVSSEQPSAIAFADIQRRLQQIPSLRDRVQLFLLGDPEWRPKQGDDESDAKPVILALSKSISPDQSNIKQRLIVRIGKVCHC
jgi:hypothetical protein